MKKIISIMLVLLLSFAMFIPANAEVDPTKLQFNKDGDFRIVQIADIQDGPALLPITKDLIRDSLAIAKPDLIVLTGDNISAGSSSLGTHAVDIKLVEIAIDKYMSIFEELDIPVAVTFGNHDAEKNVTKEEQVKIYQKYDNCIIVDDGEDIYGCGTYNVPIYSYADADKIAYNLWVVDSNMYDEENGGYDYVHQNQLDWYVNKSNELKAQNGDQPVPSMMFQHIIVREIYDALLKVDAGTTGAVERDSSYYVLNPANTKAGELNEAPCPSKTNSGQFETLKNQGDVVAMFFGHDHTNTFVVDYQGIDLVNSPGVGFNSYGDKNRGIRVIDIHENSWDYETEVISYFDVYGDDPAAAERFIINGNEFNVAEKIEAFFKYIFIELGF